MTSNIKPDVGKWYKGKGDKPRCVVHVSGAGSVAWCTAPSNTGANYVGIATAKKFSKWVTSGPFDTREEAERA